MATRAVPDHSGAAPERAHGRCASSLIPVFVAAHARRRRRQSWPAAIVFAVAGVTDQLDGYLARRWHVESEFGKVADPLADRLMIDAAVIMLVIADRLAWLGARRHRRA